MNNNNGGLYFGAGIDMTQWRRDIDKMRRDILGLTQQTQQQTRQIDNAFKKLSVGIAGYFSAQALMGFTRELIRVRGEFQQIEIAFTTMLGSGEKAKALMGDMVTLAAKTPFSLQKVASGAKQLLAYQVPAKEITDTLRRMGDIAAGLGVPLNRILLVYGQVKAKGKLMGDDLRQFSEAGIPLLAELANKYHTNTAEIQAMVSAGKIGFNDVKEVLFNMTDQGGMFFNLMEKQSKSLTGQISNLQDAFDRMLNNIGESQEGLLNSGIQGLNYLVEHYKEVIRVLTTLIETYGAYRIALTITATKQKETITPSVFQGLSNLIKLIRGATVAQEDLNKASLANPYVLLATTIAALVAITYNYRKELGELLGIIDKQTTAQEAMDVVNREYNENFALGVEQQKQKLAELRSIIDNSNSTLEQRKKAYENLISIDSRFRDTLDSQYRETYKLGEAFDFVIQKIEDFARAQANASAVQLSLKEVAHAKVEAQKAFYEYNKKNSELIDYEQKQSKKWISFNNPIYAYKVEDAKKDYEDKLEMVKKAEKVANAISKSFYKEVSNTQEKIKLSKKRIASGELTGKALEQEKKNLESLENIYKGYGYKQDDLNNITNNSNSTAKTGIIANLKQQISDIDKALESASKSDIPKLVAKKKRLTKQLNALLGIGGNKGKTGVDSAIKGSLGDLEKQLSDVQEQLNNKTLTTNKKEIARLLKQEEDLQKQIAEVKKAYGKKSFDEQMQETKRQIEVRDKLLANGYSAEVTDQMFPKIKDKSYIGYLEDTAKALREVVESGKGDEETANNLARITDEINRLNGVKEVMDKFRKSVTDGLSDIKTDAEKLDYLKQKMQALTQAEIDAGAKAYLQGEIEKVQENFKQSYKQLLEEHKTYEEKRLEIIQKYAALREEAERQNDGEAKRKVSKAMEEELNKLSMDMIQKSQEWQYAFSELEGITDASLKRILDKLLEFQEKSKGTLSIQDAATLQGAIDKVKSAGEKNPFKKLISAFDHFKEAKEDFTNANKDVEQAQKEYNQAVAEFGADSEQARNAQDKLNQAQERGLIADKKLADAKKNLISDLGDAKEIFNALGAGVRDVADAFGGFDEATNDAVEGIMNVGNAALDFATSIAQGGTAGMIKAGIQLIGSVFKALSGDKRKERHIKAWAAEVKNLENAYSSLERQLKRTLGEAKYKEQNAMIDNLKSQQRLLNQMADEEARKKHADKDKIADYRNRANAINDQIKDITDNMKNAIVGITTEGLADKLGDVLYDAWSKGVDGAKEYDKAVEDVMRNAVKNALKQKLLAPYIQGLIDELVYKLGFRVDKDGKVTGSFDGLSKWEQEDWKRRAKEKVQPFVSALNYLDDFFKDTGVDGGANSLQGAIKGMSEQTAGVLAGQFNAIRIYVAEILKIMQGGKSNSNTSIIGAEYKESLDKFAKNLETTKLNAFADMTKLKLQMQEVSNKNIESQTQLKSMVFELSKIEANTRNLHQMRRDLSEMNRKMDRNDLRPKGL